MATHTPTPTIHVYNEINEGKYKTVKHYELAECLGNPVLPLLINISKNRDCAKSMPDYWLRLREGNKWGNYVTGLFKAPQRLTYFGDTDKKKNLVLFQFSNDASTLIIGYFENFYTNDLRNLLG